MTSEGEQRLTLVTSGTSVDGLIAYEEVVKRK